MHAAAPNLKPEMLAPYASRQGCQITRVEGETYDALAAADCAIVASGTATVEAALLGTPMVVIYRVTPITAAILRHMIRTPFIGMVNLIAGRQVAPELIQDAFTPARGRRRKCAGCSSRITARAEAKGGLAEVRAKMGPGGAIERAADIFARDVVSFLTPGNWEGLSGILVRQSSSSEVSFCSSSRRVFVVLALSLIRCASAAAGARAPVSFPRHELRRRSHSPSGESDPFRARSRWISSPARSRKPCWWSCIRTCT